MGLRLEEALGRCTIRAIRFPAAQREPRTCEECDRPLEPRMRVIVAERDGFYIDIDRFKFWHYECWPENVEREIAKAIKYWESRGYR